uniref:Elongator complex protein 2 n=1 Tax=Rhodnius prolixus TaxID=13249 RepID=T1HB76_RHOPR
MLTEKLLNNDTLETCYISSGCNRTPLSVDWGENNLVCYGSRNAVMIYKPEGKGGRRVIKTLSSHKDRVNSVCWIRNTSDICNTELVSASTDHTVIVWTLVKGEFLSTAHLLGHTGPVNAIDAIYRKGNEPKSVVVVSASAQEFNCIETISLKRGLCFCVQIIVLTTVETPLLAFSTDTCHVHLYLLGSQCTKLISLTGHEDWVRTIDFTNLGNGNVFLATSSQDTTVRLWKISESSDEPDDGSFKMSKLEFSVDSIKFSVGLESVLCGHEGWVYGLQWAPRNAGNTPTLMTASLDRTIILWSPHPESGVWLERVRMGELGGNTLGYFGCKFSPTGEHILAHSYQGSFHMWTNEQDQWKPAVTIGGHFDSVVDLGWEKQGRYLLSTGLDQTTRLHAPWVQESVDEVRATELRIWSWHEMSRPQVHGYAMNCIAVLPNFSFVSGAEEKVARAFKAPKNTLENLSFLSNVQVEESFLEGAESNPTGAAVPSLGLSNQAVYTDKDLTEKQHPDNPKDEYSESYFIAQQFKEPANDDALLQNTLWPEVMKLYGHGYEVFSLAATNKGDFIASSCKATTMDHAKIFLWNTNTWEKSDELPGHQLTITQMAFSPDDKYLLSVSRDRKWCLFEKQEFGKYTLKATTDKATGVHSRIIWTCAWSHDGLYFATGSREGKLAVWSVDGIANCSASPPLNGVILAGTPLDVKEAVTAAHFAPIHLISQTYLLAVGCESGIITLYSWSQQEPSWILLYSLDNIAHHMTVKKLQFRPQLGRTGDISENNSDILQLASASLDNSVKVYNINLSNLRKHITR